MTGGGIEDAVAVQVAAGRYHSMALMTTGELYSWGEGTHGQLGHGGKDNVAVPRVVDGIGAVMAMAGGALHSLVTTEEGRVMAFGSNEGYRYEDSDREELDKPQLVVNGWLGLRAEVVEALSPAVIGRITLSESAKGK